LRLLHKKSATPPCCRCAPIGTTAQEPASCAIVHLQQRATPSTSGSPIEHRVPEFQVSGRSAALFQKIRQDDSRADPREEPQCSRTVYIRFLTMHHWLGLCSETPHGKAAARKRLDCALSAQSRPKVEFDIGGVARTGRLCFCTAAGGPMCEHAMAARLLRLPNVSEAKSLMKERLDVREAVE